MGMCYVPRARMYYMGHRKDSRGRFLKVGVIIWTLDPNGIPRFLIRHNRPFCNREDEWTVLFGNVEVHETDEEAAIRESSEEFGIKKIDNIENLDYEIEFLDQEGSNLIKFLAIKLKDINIKIVLNEESMGYDWMVISRVKEVMQYEDEKKAFDILMRKNGLL